MSTFSGLIRGPATRRPRLDRRGQALAEMAVVLPVLLLLIVGIIEMASAWRTYQVVTNAAREGARVAILPSATEDQVEDRVRESVEAGGLDWDLAVLTSQCIDADDNVIQAVCGSGGTGTEARIQLEYPYTFRLLEPVALLACGGGCSSSFGTITIRSTSTMRNE